MNDIHGMQSYLEGRVAKGEFDLNLRVLTNEQATYHNIVEGFQTHLSQAGAEDVVLFYYAGHGSQATAPEAFWPVEPDRLIETIVCYDSRIDDDHWDLADKELAKLIADIDGGAQQAGPHIVIVLDCCHSGSGSRAVETRRAGPDYRQRPLESFLVSTSEAQSLTSAKTRSLTPTGLKLPVGRHIVLSACRDIEEAKEYLGGERPQGAFSYFLQDSLAKANGPLSYRDLFKRTDALVRNNTQVQSPQMEATHSEDLEQLFLGGAIAPASPYYTVSYDPTHHWVIDGGAIHGLQPPSSSGPSSSRPSSSETASSETASSAAGNSETANSETTVLALFPFDSTPEQMAQASGAIAQVNITQVLPQLSKIDGSDPALADTTNTFKAVVLSVPLPSLAVFLEGDDVGIAAVRQAIATASPDGKPSLYIQATDQLEGARYRLLANEGRYGITLPTDARSLVTPVLGYEANSAKKVVNTLEHMARWKTIAELDSPASSQIQGAITLAVYTGEENTYESATEITHPQIRLGYTFNPSTQTWHPPKFRIKLYNSSNQTLYCALFYLTERFKVEALKPDQVGGIVRLRPDEEIWFAGGRALSGTVSEGLWQQGITECRDLLKLIACRDAFDPTLMNLGELGTPIVQATTRSIGNEGSLARLMQRVNTREMSFADEAPSYDDWVTTQIAFTFVRPQLSTPIERDAPIEVGSQVTIAAHPTLSAKARLTTVAQSTRDLGSFVMPSLFKQENITPAKRGTHTEPLQFTQSRSSDPGLSAVELSDVGEFESVTAQTPLIIESAMPLGENEYVLPIAFDGEFYLPLGYGKPNEGKTRIVLERLTEPVSEGRRSIQGSIRIFFQKVIAKKLGEQLSQQLGMNFEYPLLAAARLEHLSTEAQSEVTVVYNHDVESVKAQVAQANTIVLYVHGIFGDTEVMLPSIDTAILAIEEETRPIGQLYDLVLAFDYENLNTTIDQNARLLKQRLAAVGLGANHGKTVHIIAHSMGGLVSRWFIEQEDGNDVVNHLIMLGTPNAGSPWPQVQAGITAAVSFALNGLSIVAAPLKILHGLLQRIESLDVSLDQMQPGSDFLAEMAQAKDPGIPYTLVVGNTTLIPEDKTAGLKQKMMNKLWKVAELPFFKQPNDIAVLTESITAVPAERWQRLSNGRSPAPKVLPTACNHLEYFIHPAGLASLSAAVAGTGIAVTSGMNTRMKSSELQRAGDDEQPETPKEEPHQGELKLPVALQSSGNGINGWVWGLVAIALTGLGILAWSQLVEPTPTTPTTVEPKPQTPKP